MPHNVGETIKLARADREAFLKALDFRGDRLVLKRLGDGYTRVEEFDGGSRIYKAVVLNEQADIIEENFEGKVIWK